MVNVLINASVGLDPETTASSRMAKNFFKSRRESLGLTQRDIAMRLNLTTSAVSAWECGDAIPRLSLLSELAKAYACSESCILRVIGQMSKAVAR
jgi:transcriptional regulator with XRE-family HTH domain